MAILSYLIIEHLFTFMNQHNDFQAALAMTW